MLWKAINVLKEWLSIFVLIYIMVLCILFKCCWYCHCGLCFIARYPTPTTYVLAIIYCDIMDSSFKLIMFSKRVTHSRGLIHPNKEEFKLIMDCCKSLLTWRIRQQTLCVCVCSTCGVWAYVCIDLYMYLQHLSLFIAGTVCVSKHSSAATAHVK